MLELVQIEHGLVRVQVLLILVDVGSLRRRQGSGGIILYG